MAERRVKTTCGEISANREFAALARDHSGPRRSPAVSRFWPALPRGRSRCIAVLVWLPNPLAAIVPLVVLVSTFEVVRVLHVGVERIGRYVQVFFEEPPGEPL